MGGNLDRAPHHQRLDRGRRTRSVAVRVAVLIVAALAAPAPARPDPGDLTALVDAAAERLHTAEAVAAFKWTAGRAVEDSVRVNQELATLAADAADADLDAGYVRRVFADQINATEAVEYTRFGQWKLDPAAAPGTAPDLAASRSAIDAVNQVMVAEIGRQWDLLHSAGCTSQLDAALGAVSSARGLDALYRQALSFATRSYCRP
ncbi:chorismate mutase [Mycobacterium sp. pUA109]|uniref:chorismate mutase n=1 Tax=Mycobacterium sp. pUA109 TaxID=3238982 RepID=UPI00351B8AEC